MSIMSHRRDALKGLAGLTAVPALCQHQHPSAPDTAPKAQFFSPAELKELGEWVELIIPRTDTPGARDANVHYLIDGACRRSAAEGKAWRETLAWFGKQKGSRAEVLERISQENHRYFKRLKDATLDHYYNTREGLQTELGWNANTYVARFEGCTHKEHR
jgi:hypothetical protein